MIAWLVWIGYGADWFDLVCTGLDVCVCVVCFVWYVWHVFCFFMVLYGLCILMYLSY